MTFKITNWFKKYWQGLLAGGLVGLVSFIVYNYLGGTFTSAVVDMQSRAALSLPEATALIYFATVLAWIIIGATIGFFIDLKFSFKFPQKTRQWMIIVFIAIFVYTLFAADLERATDLGREGKATIIPAIGKAIGKLTPFWIFAIITAIAGQITGFFGGLFTPEPSGLPIWIFFIAGFVLLLFMKKRGGQQQPLMIRQ